MMRRLSALTAAALVLGLLVPAAARADEGTWVLQCRFTRSLPDDPIVHPRMPGMSHLHDFIGNATVNAASTYQSMRAGATTCPEGDTAGYWVPALYRDGVKVDPAGRGVRQQVYVSADNLAPGTHIEPFPPDLRIVVGNAHATRPSENPDLGEEIYWGCSDNSVGGKPLAPPTCASGVISLHVGFPNCWDGVLTHVDDTAHLRHPVGYRCPAGFPHALPRLILRAEYPVGGGAGSRITLSSGPTFTAHGDFWNTWDQAKLRALVDGCLNAGRDCGVFRGPGSPGAVQGSTPSPTSRTRPTVSPTHAAHSGHGTAVATTRRPHRGSALISRRPASAGSPDATLAAGGVTAPAGGGANLPFTGTSASILVALAAGLTGLGGALVARGRRRRRAPAA
jgi:hypothetical protein